MSEVPNTNPFKTKITVWGDRSCGACSTADDYFKSRSDVEYTFNSLTQKRNRDLLGKITQNTELPSETPVIQKCYQDQHGNYKCDVVTGFNKKKYEPK